MTSLDPLALTQEWLEAARATQPNGNLVASFATACRRTGRPSVRPLALVAFSSGSFRFFTAGTSRKAAEARDNPEAALHFWWPELNRVLRAEGRVAVREDEATRNEVFYSMPRAVQVAMSAAGEPGASGRNLDAIRARVKEMGTAPDPPSSGCVLEFTPDLLEFYESGEDLISVRREFRLSRENGKETWSLQLLDP